MTKLERAEATVTRLVERNARRAALPGGLMPSERDELAAAYRRRDALYAIIHHTPIENARRHYLVS